MMVNMTDLDNVSSLQGMAYYTNNMVGGILFSGGVIVFFIIMLMVLIKNGEPFENALAVSSWSMFVVSAILWLAQLLNTLLPLFFLFCAGFTTLYLYASKR